MTVNWSFMGTVTGQTTWYAWLWDAHSMAERNAKMRGRKCHGSRFGSDLEPHSCTWACQTHTPRDIVGVGQRVKIVLVADGFGLLGNLLLDGLVFGWLDVANGVDGERCIELRDVIDRCFVVVDDGERDG